MSRNWRTFGVLADGAYLVTHSNVVDAIESGREPENALRSWLATATAQYFATSVERAFGFHVLAEALRAT